MVFKKIIFQNSLMANETPSRPPPLHGKFHLKFPFWFSAPFPYPTRWPSYCSLVSSAMYLKTVKGSWGRWVFFRLKSLESLKTHGRKYQWWKNQWRRNQRWNLRSIWTTLLVFSSIAVWKIGQNTNHTSLVISFEQHLFKWPRDINCYLSWELATDNLTLFLASILDWVGV